MDLAQGGPHARRIGRKGSAMRFYAKLLLLIGLTCGFQWAFENYIDQIDETVFYARVVAFRWTGIGDEEQLIQASDRLLHREEDRYVKKLALAKTKFDPQGGDS